MIEYLFLFILAFVYLIFAIVQDFRTTEIANWLTFSFIAFALAYRAFYSVSTGNSGFFVYGLIGLAFAIVLGFVCYYGRMFAGGDAKLLMGFGLILPATSLKELAVYGGVFFASLLVCGAIYSLIYSLFLVARNGKKFRMAFAEEFHKFRFFLIGAALLGAILTVVSFRFLNIFPFLAMVILSLICVYVLALEKGVMIKVISWNKLREGDWIDENIKVGGRMIKKSVHGLTRNDIELLQKHRRSVRIRAGIPFTMAFLLAFVVTVFFFLVLSGFFPQLEVSQLFSFLS